MAEPICEDEGLLQEWTPQTQLLQQIPLKTQRGLFPHNLSLTCLDVISDYMVLGTNLGFVYWYCRETGELQRLRFENSHLSVTSVKVIAQNNYMVAAGTNQGTVTVFQIPKLKSGSTPEQLKSKQNQIERFTINDLHSAPVTCIEWSQDEYKVFSGDKNGVVALTEIDLSLHISKSIELLNEQFEIIQLSYSQQILLISTVYRSIICDGLNNWKVRQVGTKERKILGKFGATFCNFQHGLVLYASRPGHRLWLSDPNGVVQQTLIFKSAVQSSCPKIQLINPVVKKEPYDTSFGKVIQFGDNKLITYNSEILYVLHPGAVSVVSVLNSARKILDLAVNENEIFILEGERSLLRISPLPDKYTPDMFQTSSRRTSFNLDQFAAKIKDTAVESIKKITKDLIITPEQTSPNSPPALADEALELPPIVSLPAGIMPSIFPSEEIEIHSSVQDNEFNSNHINFSGKNSPLSTNGPSQLFQDCHEEVISRPLRKKHHKKSKPLSNSRESMSDSMSNPSEDRLVWGVANDLSLSDESAFSQSHSSFSVLRDISSLLNQPKPTQKHPDPGNEDVMKTSDNKSQTSLDTCESVSERLLLTSEMFREEQEKTFARLANQPISLLDSMNSEKTDNMSISLNMTTSSSVSSKISENLHSPSYTSENSGAPSRAKSTESQSTDNYQNELPVKEYWRSDSNMTTGNASGEDRITGSTESSVSSRNSQRERLYPRWAGDETEDSSGDVLEREEDLRTAECPNNECTESGCSGSENLENGKSDSVCEMSETEQGDEHVEFPQFPNLQDQFNCQPPSPPNSLSEDKEEKPKTNFSVAEPLSYGPPSGSSMLSSQPSSDFSSYPSTSQSQIHDSYDQWPQYKAPERLTSFSASVHYVICTDVNDKLYFSHLSGLALFWILLDHNASMVRVSNDGRVIWLLHKKSLLALVDPMRRTPLASTSVEIAKNVKSFAIDSSNNNGWILTLNGKILSYDKKVKEARPLEVPCDYLVADIACADGMILALTNDDTVLYKTKNEKKFNVISTIKGPTCSLALGPDNLLWVVDETNNIRFSDDFLSDNPHWWQVHISDYIFQNSSSSYPNICNKIKLNELKANLSFKNTLIATNENSVWVYDKYASTVSFNKTGFTGYIWNKTSSKILPTIQWQMLCAKGVSGDDGRVWVLSVDENIFCISPNYQKFQSIPVPCEEKILCLTSSVDTLWVLSENGRIHSRIGLNKENISGVSWRELKSSQIDNLRFTWVSCGSDVAWACDIHGRTFMTVGSQNQMATLDPVWLEVEGRPKDVQFVKVFVGSQLYMVWAIDSKQNLYVREGIFPRYQRGTSWVYVCGIEAVHVTISGTSVWALSSNGNIYKRCGVSESNFIGDYWKSIPGSLKMISSSSNGDLWGITQENKILRLLQNFKVLTGFKMKQKSKTIYSSKEDVSWEIVE